MIDKKSAPSGAPEKQSEGGSFNFKNRILWTVVFLAIAAVSIWAVVSQIKNFSFANFVEFIKSADIFWLCTAVVSMIGFIIFEGVALLYICRSFGYKQKFRNGFVYSAADIYFSAITPSATGGQPASAYFMIKDGIPGTFVTFALVVNLVMYTASIVGLGVLSIILNPAILANFGLFSKFLIALGYVIQIVLLSFFILLLTKKGLLHRICSGGLKLLGKLHLVRKPDQKLEKLEEKMEEYSKHTSMLKGKGKLLAAVFLLNLLQRVCSAAVTPLTFLASGGDIAEAFKVFITQIYVMVGANCIPIPGAMGVTDYLMLDGFENLNVANPGFLELLSRSLSFYMCITICGFTVLLSYIILSKRRKKL